MEVNEWGNTLSIKGKKYNYVKKNRFPGNSDYNLKSIELSEKWKVSTTPKNLNFGTTSKIGG